MIKRLWISQKGMLLAWVLLLLGVLSILTVAALTLASNQLMMGTRYSSSVKSLHYAEAGIHHYLAYLNSDGAATAPPQNEDITYEDGCFRLRVDEESGKKVLRATGWTSQAGKKSDPRTVDVVLKKRTFTEYGYFTHDNDNLWWMFDESCYGPYHTNGDLSILGTILLPFKPHFYGAVTYGKKLKIVWGKPVFHEGVSKVSPIPMPLSNNDLKNWAQEQGGYYYEGRTCILLKEDGTICVRKNDGTIENRNLPPNGVIYVNGDTVSYKDRFARNSGNVFVSGTLKGCLTIAASNDIYITGYDPTKWIPKGKLLGITYFNNKINTKANRTGGITYASTSFTAIKEGRTTVGYSAEGDDMLGLVANNNIWLVTYGWFKEGGGSYSLVNAYPSSMTVHGALFAVNGRFGHGDGFDFNIFAGTLTIRGALIQKNGGKVGGIFTGYDKDYAHDKRMIYEAPPHFPAPEESGWEITDWTESREHLDSH